AAAAIAALGLTGSIGIDFPTLAGRADRQRIDALLDAALPPPFERTAMNGFGFVQIIRRRERPSLCERTQLDPVLSDALALLRQAERALGTGPLTLSARASVTTLLAARPRWIEELQQRTGRAVMLRAEDSLKGCGHAQ
ncbi:MAG: ribonuclease, partial [Sphingopyxis sp.]|nr:ribonuclease [Sphingopyxis sp.]